jgi:hypothetical protein
MKLLRWVKGPPYWGAYGERQAEVEAEFRRALERGEPFAWLAEHPFDPVPYSLFFRALADLERQVREGRG